MNKIAMKSANGHKYTHIDNHSKKGNTKCQSVTCTLIEMLHW